LPHRELPDRTGTKLPAAVQKKLKIWNFYLCIIPILLVGLLAPQIAGSLFQLQANHNTIEQW